MNVNVKPLKSFASEKFPQGSAVRDLLLSEKDELDPKEFLVKSEYWMKLLSRL